MPFPLFFKKMAKKTKKDSSGTPGLSAAQLEVVREAAERAAAAVHLRVHEVTFGPTDFGPALSVFIKAEPGGKPIGVSDCEAVSRPLAKELDELLEDFAGDYLFEVTSVGVTEQG